MTVSSQTSTATFVGNGVATAFPLPFRFFDNGDIRAYFIDSVTGAATQMVLGTDYTLLGAGEPEVDGSALSLLTTTAPLASMRGLYVERVMSQVQETDIVNQGQFFASTHEDVFDRLTMLIQQANANSNGAIRVAIGDPEPQRLPPSAQRALKLLSFDANGQPVVTSPASGSATDLELRLADAITPNNGASLVGYKGRTVQSALADRVSIQDFFIPGQLDWTAAFQAARDYASAKSATAEVQSLFFPQGSYSYSVSPNWAITGLHLDFDDGVTLRHTGTGAAFILDGGATGPGKARMIMSGMPQIIGSTNTTNCLFIQAIHHSKIYAKANSCNFSLVKIAWSVCCEYWFLSSSLFYGPNSPQPTAGVELDERGAGETVSACTFHNPIIENIAGIGVVLNAAQQNTFIGGTSETNTSGVYISPTSTGNTFLNLDLEFNSGADDIVCDGDRNAFINCLSTKRVTFGAASSNNSLVGGAYNSVAIGGYANTVSGASFGNALGTLEDSGTGTRITGVVNLTTGLLVADKHPPVVTPTLTLSGSKIIGFAGAYSGSGVLAKFNNQDDTGAPHTVHNVNGTSGSASNCGLRTSADSVTGRGINAGGTVNAAGADYAEYVRKAAGCPDIKKGDVCGVNRNGELVASFDDAVTFVIKSTNPSYVGGDYGDGESREDFDRIAFAGIVPVNVLGCEVGDYVIPAPCGHGITAYPTGNPTFDQYRLAIGRVWSIGADGRPIVSVKVC